MTKKYDYALVSGGFDPVHIGHLRMFKDAKKLAKKVIVLLNNDDWLIKKKGKPFMSQEQRKEILEEFESISKVIVQKSSEKKLEAHVSWAWKVGSITNTKDHWRHGTRAQER